MEVKGEIVAIGETEVFGTKGFKKRQLVVKTDSEYPQFIPIDFTQDKCLVLNAYRIGQFVKVSINIQGREWQGKYYVNLQAWEINGTNKEVTSESFMPDRQAKNDDLPF